MRAAGGQDRRAEARDVALGLAMVCGRIGVTAGRFALLPFRVAARSPVVGPVLDRTGGSLAEEGRNARARGFDQVEAVAGEVLASPQLGRAVDQAMASPLPETVTRSLVDQQVVRRIVEQVLESADLEAAVNSALENATTERLVEQTLASPGFEGLLVSAAESLLATELTERAIQSAETQRLIEEVASSPAVRAALFGATTTLSEEMAAGLRARVDRIDDAAERTVHGWLRRSRPPEASASGKRATFGGLGSRGIAFAIDLAIGTTIFLACAAGVWLVTSLVGGRGPGWLAGFLASSGWTVIVCAYLVLFWTVTGQTPGMRLMRLRVVDSSGNPPRVWRSFVRLIGLVLAIVPLFAGFIPVVFDDRRRALQDFLARTVVRAEPLPPAIGESVAKGTSPDGRPAAKAAPEVPVQLE